MQTNTLIQHAFLAYLKVTNIECITPISTGSSAAKNFKVVVQNHSYFVRLLAHTQPLKHRQQEAQLMQLADQHQLAPSFYYHCEDYLIFITEYVSGQNLSIQDLHQPACLQKVMQLIKQVHQIPCEHSPKALNAYERIDYYAQHAPHALKKQLIEHANLQTPLQRIQFALRPHYTLTFTHNDLNIENIYRSTQQRMYFLDWSDAGQGDRFLDLAMIAMLFEKSQRDRVLFQYFAHPTATHQAQLALTCALLLVVFAAWGLQQIAYQEHRIDTPRSLESLSLDPQLPRFYDIVQAMKENRFHYNTAENLQYFYETCLKEFIIYISSAELKQHLATLSGQACCIG